MRPVETIRRMWGVGKRRMMEGENLTKISTSINATMYPQSSKNMIIKN
jgi:hypothetical protein